MQSSITVNTLKRRQSVNWSETKSSDHRWFGMSVTSIGARVPSARLRPPIARQAIAQQMPRGTLAHRQLFFAIQPKQTLVIDRHPLAPEQHVDAPIPKSAALTGNGFHAIAKYGIMRPHRRVSYRHPATLQKLARPPLAHLLVSPEMGDSFPAPCRSVYAICASLIALGVTINEMTRPVTKSRMAEQL